MKVSTMMPQVPSHQPRTPMKMKTLARHVVEDLVGRHELVRAPELDERCGEVLLLVQLDAALEAVLRFILAPVSYTHLCRA